MKRKKPSGAGVSGLVTATELATLESTSPATVCRWAQKGCPRVGKGRKARFDPAAVRAWREATQRTGARGRRPASAEAMDAVLASPNGKPPSPELAAKLDEAMSAHADLNAERARKEKALADYHELRVKRLKGQLLDAREVEAGRVGRIQAVKAALLGLVDRVAPAVVGRDEREVRGLLEGEVLRILEGFARG